MDFNFEQSLDLLGRDAAFQIFNETRPPSEYLFETLLPEESKGTYHVETGFMLIRAIMAGLVGMSSPYPPGSVVEASTFLQKSGKVACENVLEEEALRQLQQILMQRGIAGADRVKFLADEALNFYSKVTMQGHFDTAEWLRAQALVTGGIDWTFNNSHLKIDYGVPASYFQTNRADTNSYDGTASTFWADHYIALQKLFYNVRCIIMHSTTFLKIANQPFNGFNTIGNMRAADGTNIFTVQRYVLKGGVPVISNAFEDQLQVICYDLEGEVLNPANTALTERISFMPQGKILYVANNKASGYRVGEGSTPDPIRAMALGYTHIAPTVEGGGTPGRWGDMFVPEKEPWALHARGVTNLLPVREDVSATQAKTYVLSTDLS